MDKLTHPTQQAQQINRCLAIAATGVMVGLVANVGFEAFRQRSAYGVRWSFPLAKAAVLATTTIGLVAPCILLSKLLSPVERACSWRCERQLKALFADWRAKEGNTRGVDMAIDRIIKAHLNQETALDLSDLGLTSLPPQLFELKQLQRLGLSKNPLGAFPQELCSLTSLKWLGLVNCGIDSLPTEIEQLTQLETLDLSDNSLGAFPQELCSLTSLQTLSLGSCGIDLVSAKIGQLTQLQNLNLSKNPLGAFPQVLCSLISLQKLELWNSQIRQVPTEIEQLTQLESLDLNNNPFNAFPQEVCSLTSLQTLSLGSCGIDLVSTKIEQLTQLETLDLSSNELTSLPSQIEYLKKLLYLDVHGNPNLASLPMQLANCPDCNIAIYVHGVFNIFPLSPILEKQAEAIEIARRRNARREPLENSPTDLALWKRYQGKEYDFLSKLTSLPTVEQLAYTELLKKFDSDLDLTFAEGQAQIDRLLEERSAQRFQPLKSARSGTPKPHSPIPTPVLPSSTLAP